MQKTLIPGDTLSPLKNNKIPQTFSELWDEFDPRKEPLDVEILKEWEEDGAVIKVVRYCVGTFKGQKSMLAAIYGYPKGGNNLPALVQIHGGGQSAHANAIIANAKEGYATISVAWAGRLCSSEYLVSNDEKVVFWEGKTDDPKYLVTTDWGAIDAYHHFCRNPKNDFCKNSSCEDTIDGIESPRNSGWFPCTMGTRRAITFLEQQPEVDGDKIGVYGHSMGGKLTVLTAGADDRIKAAAPSCGGLSDLPTEEEKIYDLVKDDAYLKNIKCPIIFLSPSNDFHGLIQDLPQAINDIKSKDWRVVCSPHINHRDWAQHAGSGMVWFNQYLKDEFKCPETPASKLELNTADGTPVFTVKPDAAKKILSVDIYYTQQTEPTSEEQRHHSINKFWHYAKATENKGFWQGKLPLLCDDKPLWVYADVTYYLEKEVSGASYYYAPYTTDKFNISSLMLVVTADELHVAGVKPTLKPTTLIENFQGDWEKEWFRFDEEDTSIRTHKIYNDMYKAPSGNSKLSLEVKSEKANKLVLILDEYGAEVELTGKADWQTVVLEPGDFLRADDTSMESWKDIRELAISIKEENLHFNPNEEGKEPFNKKLGAEWQGKKVQFKDLKWV